MRLKQLTLWGYRNLSEQTCLEPGPGLNIITGQNAQGKTNLLEAVYLCCTGRSHRTAKDRELIARDGERAAVHAVCCQRDGDHVIDMKFTAGGRKQILVNGSPLRRMGQLMGHMNAVIFSPEDLMLVKGGPAERRRFINMTLAQIEPGYFYLLQRYQRVLQQRNALLRQIRTTGRGEEQLALWDGQLAENGVQIVERRRKFCDRMGIQAQEIHSELTGGREKLQLTYLPADEETTLLQKLYSSHEQDIRAGTTTVGPHRDDLSAALDTLPLRVYGSQGQQRTAALAMKLSELRLMEEITGEAPILLLDDVFSELDAQRRVYLAQTLSRVQTLLTCVDIESTAPGVAGQARIFQMQAGMLSLRQH